MATYRAQIDPILDAADQTVNDLNVSLVSQRALTATAQAATAAVTAEYAAYRAAHPVNAREALVAGTYRPSAATTGIVPGVALTLVPDPHVPVSGATYTALDIGAVTAPNGAIGNVTYINCLFRGAPTAPTGFSSLYTMFRPHLGGFTFIDCTFAPQTPSPWWVGIQGYGFTLRRCDLSNLGDQVEVFNPNNGPGGAGDNSLRDGPCHVVIEQCYFHDSAYFGPGVKGEASKDGTHADNVQWEGGTGLIVRGNYFTGQLAPAYQPNHVGGTTANAAMMIKPDAGAISGAVITKNWLGGGAVTINVANSPAHSRVIANLGQLTDNRFGRDQFYRPTTILFSNRTIAATATGNVFDDNSAPVPINYTAA